MDETLVRKWFIKAIQQHPSASPELKRALFNKESQLKQYTHLLFKELAKCESHVALKKGKSLKTDTYKSFVADMANGFVLSMEKNANDRMQSDLKRLAVQKQKQDQADMDATFNGTPQGDLAAYVEEGSLIIDESQLQRP
jgi:hypothetical protein